MKSKEEIKGLKDIELRDEILRANEQQEILEMTVQEYKGYLLILKAERKKRRIENQINLRKQRRLKGV